MAAPADSLGEFYVRYYVGHKGKFGHEFFEFEVQPDGTFRYANNSKYKGSGLIRKQAFVTRSVQQVLKKIVTDSDILKTSDERWPEPTDVGGRQELEIVCDDQHISFICQKVGSMRELEDCEDAEGLKTFYYLVQDLKAFVLALSSMHFKIKPIS